jgi:UMF1 family MFS transporter
MTAVANALIPSLAKPGQLGRLSAFGWAMGYFGGLASLIFVLAAFTLPAEPLFGLNKALHEPERLTGPISALWFLVFGLPLLIVAPGKPLARPPGAAAPLTELKEVLISLPRRPVILRFLIGRMLVGDGVAAIVAFAGVLAGGLFHWEPTERGLYGMLLAAAAGIGAITAGRLDDRFGSKPTTLVAAAVLTTGMFGMLLIGAGGIAGVAVAPAAEGDGLFASIPERAYLIASFVLGLAFGPLQSSLRAWMAKLAPPEEAGRLFGLFTLSGKASAFAAPLAIAIVTQVTGQQKSAIVVAALFVAAGCAVLATVKGRGTEAPAAQG